MLSVIAVLLFIFSVFLSDERGSSNYVMILFVIYLYGYHLVFSFLFNEDMFVTAFDLPPDGNKPLRVMFAVGGALVMIGIIIDLLKN